MMVSKLRNFLNQPYPEEETLPSYLRSSVGTGLAIFLILYLLRPFGIENSQQIFFTCAVFGLITFGLCLAFDLVVFYIFGIARDKPTWTFWKWLLSSLILMAIVSFANFLAVLQIDQAPYTWGVLGQMTLATLLVGSVPLVMVGAFKMGAASVRNQKTAQKISIDGEFPVSSRSFQFIRSDTGQPISLMSEEIYFIEAMQNYVKLFHQADGEVEQTIIRKTMKELERTFKGSDVMRCHRSYLVNRSKITAVAGNAQGLKLTLRDLPNTILPVSRKYIRTFR